MSEKSLLTAPLVPGDVDLVDFQYIKLDVRRLRDSRIASAISGEEFRCAVLLWCAAWHQQPAASLPDDDVELSQLAGFGRAVGEWRKVREGALYGWIKCADGRLYHPVVAEKAMEAWTEKLVFRWKRECDRVRKANKTRVESGLDLLPLPPNPAESVKSSDGTIELSIGNDQGSGGNADHSDGNDDRSHGKHAVSTGDPDCDDGNPLENALKGRGKGIKEKKECAAVGAPFEFENRPPPIERRDPGPIVTNDEADLFRRGKEILGPSGGGLISKLLKCKSGNIPLARAAIEMASTKQDAREYVGALIRGSPEAKTAADLAAEQRARGDRW